MVGVVDVHTHVVPAHIPSRPRPSGHWPSITLDGNANAEASVLINGRVFRRIDSRCWDVARRLDDMREDGVEVHVLSPMPELLSHWMEADEAEALAEIVNADIVRMISEAPGRFAGIGMVPVQDSGCAVSGLEALKRQGLHGIEIGTHINGTPLGHPSLWPVYEAAADLGLAIFVHPLHPAGVERIGRTPEYAAVAAFPLETALAAVSLMAAGVLDRFPRLKVLLSHGGGALPWILPRLDYGRTLGGNVAKDFVAAPTEVARKLWYDTVLYSDRSLRFLSESVGADRIVVGSDYPFTIRQVRPGVFAADALGENAPCLHANAEAFLGLRFPSDPLRGGESSFMTETTLRCRSPLQFVSLGPVPPRMPGRTDAQVPNALDDGPVHYARFGHLYFYNEEEPADPAFGFVDIEISLQRLGDEDYQREIYCVGDGYQCGHGDSNGAPLQLQFAAGERVVGTVDWPYPPVRSGTSDPITFRAPIAMADADFKTIDRVIIPPAVAACRVALD